MKPILHICERKDWETALKSGIYQPDSLLIDGFIHASLSDQVLDAANNFFCQRSDLILLWIDPDFVQPEIRWEPAHDGVFLSGKVNHNQVFPHIYGALNLDSVIRTSPFKPDADGFFRSLVD